MVVGMLACRQADLAAAEAARKANEERKRQAEAEMVAEQARIRCAVHTPQSQPRTTDALISADLPAAATGQPVRLRWAQEGGGGGEAECSGGSRQKEGTC